jgi:hypothetical protein
MTTILSHTDTQYDISKRNLASLEAEVGAPNEFHEEIKIPKGIQKS